MHYKTIVLELLQQYPEIHNQLRSKRTLLPTMERHARRLKARHEVWKDRLDRARPGSDPGQIASEALEMAVKELTDFLHSAPSPEDSEPLSLEGAMAFIRGRTPPA
jgi:hypothetical protein